MCSPTLGLQPSESQKAGCKAHTTQNHFVAGMKISNNILLKNTTTPYRMMSVTANTSTSRQRHLPVCTNSGYQWQILDSDSHGHWAQDIWKE